MAEGQESGVVPAGATRVEPPLAEVLCSVCDACTSVQEVAQLKELAEKVVLKWEDLESGGAQLLVEQWPVFIKALNAVERSFLQGSHIKDLHTSLFSPCLRDVGQMLIRERSCDALSDKRCAQEYVAFMQRTAQALHARMNEALAEGQALSEPVLNLAEGYTMAAFEVSDRLSFYPEQGT